MCPAARCLCGLLPGLVLLTSGCNRTRGNPEPRATNNPTVAFTQAGDTPPIPQPLAAPLALNEPPAEPTELNGENIALALPSELARLAKDFASRGNFPLAARYQYWYVRQTGEGRYDLARFYAGAGNSDASLYWLQAAARDEGVSLDDLGREDAFRVVLHDSRWPAVRSFLQSSLREWEAQGQPITTLVLPHGYTRDRGPLWVIAWLHDAGSNPHGLVNTDDEDADCRFLAESLNIAFVGISATTTRGKNAYTWTEEPQRDLGRVQVALGEVSKRLTMAPAGVILVGSSQGGRVAMDLAARNPDLFAGAIAFASGKQRSRLVEIASRHPMLAQRSFVLVGNDAETADDRTRTAGEAAWLENAKARVMVEVVPGSSALPLHFARAFPNWVKWMQTGPAK